MNTSQALEVIIGAKTDANYQAKISGVRNDIAGLKNAALGLAGVFAGISVAGLLKDASKAAADYQAEMFKLEAVVKATGGAAGFTAQQLDEMARAEDLATLGNAQNIRAAISELLTFKSVQGDVFERAISAANDMSAVFGQDITGSVTQLGKALEDPVKGISALSRVGVTFTESQQNVIKSLVESGDLMQAQGIILEALEGQVGGASEAMAQGMAGALDTLGFHWNELMENIGGSANSVFVPVVNGISEGLESLNHNFDAISGAIRLSWGEAVDFINASALSVITTIRDVLAWIPDASARVRELDAVIANLQSAGSYAAQVENELITEFKKANDITVNYEKSTAATVETLDNYSDSAKKSKKATDDLAKEQEKQIGILNNLADQYERAANPQKDWDKVDALKGLTGEMYDAGAAILDMTREQEAFNAEFERQIAIDEEIQKGYDERIKKQQQLTALQTQASRGFEGAFISGLSSGGLSGAANSLINFMGSDSASNFSFENLFGGYGFDSLGGSVDSLVSSIGGLQNAASYLGGATQLLSGTSAGAMQGIGTILGTAIGGPLGGSLGSFVGGTLNSLGIGGSGPYSGKGFQATGNLFDMQLAALTQNNKGSKTDLLDLAAGTFGPGWNINEVLAGNKSLGQDQLKYLLQVNEQVEQFRTGLEETVGNIGDLFGQDLLTRFQNSFDASIDISGENFESAFGQWLATTAESAIDFAGDLVDTSGFDNLQKLLYDIGAANDFNSHVMNVAAASIENLRQTMQFLDLDTQLITSDLIAMSGGFDNLQSSLAFFNQEFIPETERQARSLELATQELNAAFASMGEELPATREAFRDFFEGITDDAKLATTSGALEAADVYYDELEKEAPKQAAAARVVINDVLRPGIDYMLETTTTLADAYDTAAVAQNDYIASLLDSAQTLNDWLNSQILGDTSSLSTSQKLDEAQRQAFELYQQAQAGDTTAANSLPAILDEMLSLRRDVYGSAGYAAYEAQVRAGVGGLASQYGTGITPAPMPVLTPINTGASAPAAAVPASTGNIDADILATLKAILQKLNGATDEITQTMRLTATEKAFY